MECNAFTSKTLTTPSEKNPREPNSYCTTISLLEGEETFFNRLLSRDSSNGFSSRIYHRVAGKVPFEWETQPGKSKAMSESAPIWPLSPPPAMQSMHMGPLRCKQSDSKGSTRSGLWFWKKKKGAKAPKSQSQGQSQARSDESFETWSSVRKSTWSSSSSPRNSSSLWLSSLSFGSPALQVGKRSSPEERKTGKDLRKGRGMEGLEWAWSCSPWGFPGAMVCMAPEA